MIYSNISSFFITFVSIKLSQILFIFVSFRIYQLFTPTSGDVEVQRALAQELWRGESCFYFFVHPDSSPGPEQVLDLEVEDEVLLKWNKLLLVVVQLVIFSRNIW